MIPEKDFMRYEKQTSKLYEELELQLIQDIAERIANVGELNTVGYNNAEILQEMGYLYDDIINDVAKFNNMNSTEVKAIFEKAGIKSIKKDDIIYKQAGISPGKISDTLVNIMERQADTTNYNILRLTRTTAMTGQNQFINAINQAYLETSSGMKSYSQSIIDAVNQVSKTGAIVQYPTGTIRSLESAVRMNVLTSIGQMSGELQLERAKEVGWDLVEVSAHIGARPEHAEWQGKVYSLTGSNGYKDFYQETGYGDMLGLCGINCRHTFYPFYKGSTTTYTKSELEEMKNAKVYYNGKEMSYYDATQLQRRMERQIRQNRKDIAGLNGLQNSDVDNQDLKLELQKVKDKLTRNQNTLSDFIQQTGFKDNDRTYIGSGKAVVKKEIKKEVKMLTNEQLNQHAKDELKNIYERNRVELGLTSVPVKDIKDDNFSPFKVDFGNVDNTIANNWFNQFQSLADEYYTTLTEIKEKAIYDGPLYNPRVINRTDQNLNISQSTIYINNNLTNHEKYLKRIENMVNVGHSVKVSPENYEKYVPTHEFAHTLSVITQDRYKSFVGADVSKMKDFSDAVKKLYADYQAENVELNEKAKLLNNKFLLDTDNWTDADQKERKEIAERLKNIFVSKYANENEEEFMAECFTDYKIGENPSEYSIKVGKLIDKYFKRGNK